MEKFTDSLGTQINVVARCLRLYLEKKLMPLEISPSQWMLLMALGEKDHQVQTDLARMINLDNATVTRIIDKLEERKVLVRNQNSDDRRVQIVSLTAKGKNTYKKWNALGEEVNNQAKTDIAKEDILTFLRVAESIRHNLNDNASNDLNSNKI